MAEPLDVIKAFHNGFRNDMAAIDRAALENGRGKTGLAPTIERFRFFNEVLVWHANGEEAVIFPALEAVVPNVAEAYKTDHRGLDLAFDMMDEAVAAKDALETARASAAFKFHLDIHLAKEDAHLYRLVRECVAAPDVAQAVGNMASLVPQDRFPEIIAWLIPLIEDNDRENMIRIWQMTLPPAVFMGMKSLILKAAGNGKDELKRRIPSL
jgi:hypothetical protein